MKPFNRFDMEQQIMNCWNVCEDLEVVNEGVLEGGITQDRVSNMLIGIKEVYHLKFEKLWESFESMCNETKECSPVVHVKSFDWETALRNLGGMKNEGD